MALTAASLVWMAGGAPVAYAACTPADTGTAGDDVILCNAANAPAGPVNGLGGNDILTLDGVFPPVNVNSGAGMDTINLINGAGASTIEGGGDVDTINLINGSVGGRVDWGGGDETVVVDLSGIALGGRLIMGDGSDHFTLTGGTVGSFVQMGNEFNSSADTDTFILNGGTIDSLVAGDNGDDTITLVSGVVNAGANPFGSVGGLGGDDTVSIFDGVTLTGAVDGMTHNAGGDTIIVNTVTGRTFDASVLLNFENLQKDNSGIFTLTGALTFTGTTVVNDGTLAVSGSLTTPTVATGAGNGDFTINAGGAASTNVQSGAGTHVFTFADTLTGNVALGGGNDTVNLNGGNVTSNITDSVAGNASLNVNALASVGGDITVSDTVLNETGDLTANTLSTDNLTFGLTDNANFATLTLTGGAVNLTGVTVQALVNAGATAASFAEGDELLVATGTAPLIGTDGAAGQALTAITDDFLLYDFEMADGAQAGIIGSIAASDLYLKVVQAATATGSAITENAKGVGAVMEKLTSSPDPQMTTFINSISAVSTQQELEDLLQKALPAIDGGSFTAAQNTTSNTIRLVTDRLSVLRIGHGNAGPGQSGMSSGDIARELQIWTQAFGQVIHQGRRGEVAGFDADTYGWTVGVDTEALYDDMTLGMALTYAHTDVDSKNANASRSDIDNFQIALYGDYDLDPRSFVAASVGYTYGDNKTRRSNVGGIAGLGATGAFSSHQYEARFRTGRDYYPATSGTMRITPFVSAHYLYYDTEKFTETGAGGLSLTVDSQAMQVLDLGIGVDVKDDYDYGDGSIITPEFSVGYTYDVIGDQVQTTSNFSGGGGAFETEGLTPAPSKLNLGLAVGYTDEDDWQLSASYDYDRKSDFNSHSFFVRGAYQF